MQQFVGQLRPAERDSHHGRTDMLFVGVVLAVMTGVAGAVAWLFWVLSSGALGRHGAILAMMTVPVGALAVARWTGQSIASSLILVGFCAVALLIGGMFGIAAWALLAGW